MGSIIITKLGLFEIMGWRMYDGMIYSFNSKKRTGSKFSYIYIWYTLNSKSVASHIRKSLGFMACKMLWPGIISTYSLGIAVGLRPFLTKRTGRYGQVCRQSLCGWKWELNTNRPKNLWKWQLICVGLRFLMHVFLYLLPIYGCCFIMNIPQTVLQFPS